MNLDKFYTKKEVSKNCIKLVNIEDYLTIIEPSAGNGSFTCFLPKRAISLDLEPENKEIIKQNFFNFDYSNISRKCLVIGNPPFGKRAKTAIDFFNYASNFTDTIAFIVPLQFRKWSVQNKLSYSFGLYKDYDLEPNIFYYEDKEFSIRCCFQIWHNKTNFDFENLRIKQKPAIKHDDFTMWQYNNTKQALKYFDKEKYKWNFAIPRQGYYDYSTRETNPENMSKKIQWIFFKSDKEETLKKISSIDFDKLAKNNTTIPGFGKADVVKEYNNLYRSKN
jgi:hypothetical protein